MDYHIIFKQAKCIEQYQIELKENFVQTLSAKTQVNKKSFKEICPSLFLQNKGLGFYYLLTFSYIK